MEVRLISLTQPLASAENPESLVAYCARVSSPNQDNPEHSKLLRYCLKHGHWSPFEMADMTLEITTSRAISAQILRHRSFSFQEFSQRYAEALDYEPCGARRQDETNRQNSLDDLDENVREWFMESQVEMWHWAKRRYDKALALGVAKECARMLLPLNTWTRLYMKGSLRSWIHYIQVRTAPETQLEHREIAEKAKAIFCENFPTIATALEWN